MAIGIKSQIDKIIQSKSGQKKMQRIVDGANNNTLTSLKDEAEILKKCIEKRIRSEVSSKYILRLLISLKCEAMDNNEGFEIYFDETKATQESIMPSYRNRGIGAFRPLLANEGYLIRNGMFKGMTESPTYFIEKGIEDYKSKHGDKIRIKVIKKWDIQYTKDNKTINSIDEY